MLVFLTSCRIQAKVPGMKRKTEWSWESRKVESRFMMSWSDGGQQVGVGAWIIFETSGVYAVLILFVKNNKFIFPVQNSCLCIIWKTCREIELCPRGSAWTPGNRLSSLEWLFVLDVNAHKHFFSWISPPLCVVGSQDTFAVTVCLQFFWESHEWVGLTTELRTSLF